MYKKVGRADRVPLESRPPRIFGESRAQRPSGKFVAAGRRLSSLSFLPLPLFLLLFLLLLARGKSHRRAEGLRNYTYGYRDIVERISQSCRLIRAA